VNREVQAAVLFLVGGAMVYAGSTTLFLRYVKAGLQPLLIGAGAVLIVTAAATAWYELRRSRANRLHRAEHDHAGGHAHREPRVSWLLVLPLFALVLVGPPALGSYSAARTGTALAPSPWSQVALPAGDPLPLSVVDYASRAVYDQGRSLGGRSVTLVGFITLDDQGEYFLTRMMLNCCAADAQPIKLGLSGQVPPVLQPDGWLEITGTYTAQRTTDPVNGGPIPFIDVSRAVPVAPPAEPYESWLIQPPSPAPSSPAS
jgi:uncharacterized repeat protein (TIGR03943 family)